VGAELFHADGLPEGRSDEANSRFFAILRTRLKRQQNKVLNGTTCVLWKAANGSFGSETFTYFKVLLSYVPEKNYRNLVKIAGPRDWTPPFVDCPELESVMPTDSPQH
jgi:hypothetical protein